MKLILSLMTLSLFSFANVGDQITHTVNYMGTTGTQTQIVRSLSPDGQTYSVEWITNYNGTTQSTIEETPVDELFTKEQGTMILAYCAQAGGVNEMIRGMETCKISGDSLEFAGVQHLVSTMDVNTVWIGKVPVNGIVKALLSNGVTLDLNKGSWAK